MSESSDRVSKLFMAAKACPDFALRFLATLPPSSRNEALRRFCVSNVAEPATVSGPGLRKCAVTLPTNNGMSAQLTAFARSVGRVR
jgi:hypothetical protein